MFWLFLTSIFLGGADTWGQSIGKGPLSIPDLVARSDTVVIGKIQSVHAEWAPNRAIVQTRVELKIDEVLKGFRAHSHLSFYQPGGHSDGMVSSVAGTPSFEPGEKVLLFL